MMFSTDLNDLYIIIGFRDMQGVIDLLLLDRGSRPPLVRI